MHHGACDKGRNKCFKCGLFIHLQGDYPLIIVTTRANIVSIVMLLALTVKVATCGFGTGQNYMYAYSTHHESEASPDVITGTLQLFSHDVYCVLDLGSTLSYVTPYIAVYFGFDP